MGGHNKWSQIKRQKGAADAAKSNIWGKLSRRITVESKKCGGDVQLPSLRAVIEKAKSTNMPKDAIDRAVAKGISAEAGSMESITYETYGPGGVAILIEALTDSRNRTAQEIKHLLSENGLALAAPGSAAWAFEKTTDGPSTTLGTRYEPKTTVPLSPEDAAKLREMLEKISEHDDVEEIYTNDA
ncbi:MAG: transcriptional regulator [Parcubacteria group bacterium GW2011_GWA2_51_10]|nr:MAG: transcriptional regulator [Parcubacteria group bacterium GW2011_GWA2_51_10]